MSSSSPSSSSSVEYKLRKIWKKIQVSHPILCGLADISDKNVDLQDAQRLKACTLNAENIIKNLGTPIIMHLLKAVNTYYFHVCAGEAKLFSKIDSCNENNPEAPNISPETTEPDVVTMNAINLDELDLLRRINFKSDEWYYCVFSIIEDAFKYFTYKPRYVKEACVLGSSSNGFKFDLDIKRGDILCAKRYNEHLRGIALTSYYHFGVYVGTINDKDGNRIEDAVIHVRKDTKANADLISVCPLVGKKEDECFLQQDSTDRHPPLLFKVIYENRIHPQKSETAKRAEDIYRNLEHYTKKYNILKNNCEHFVHICVLGTPYCEQHVKFAMTSVPNLLKFSTPVFKYLPRLINLFGEISEKFLSLSLRFIGESGALIMLLAECAFRIFWELYNLKASGCLTYGKVIYVLKKKIGSMAPELITALLFLLVALSMSLTGPLGIGISILGVVVLLVLRFTARPKIERWIEELEFERRNRFAEWHPSEVARLIMRTADDEEPSEAVIDEFKSRKLSGEMITEFIREKRQSSSEVSFDTILQFLSLEQSNQFKQNLSKIFGHLDLKEHLKSSVTVIYGENSFRAPIDYFSPITVRQLLNMAKLNWGINFEKNEWQLMKIDSQMGTDENFASGDVKDSLDKKIQVNMIDIQIELKLLYCERKLCILI